MKDSSTATERVGRYQLLEPIGGGPNGLVARAKVFGVAGFERQFAVKRFLVELTTGASAQALSAAARSYGSLEHPRIARMSEFGVAQGQTFTAVEYVAGLDVFRLMQEAKLASVAIAAGGALALVSQAARAVGYAHGRGLSHLGLSPTNVIVTADGDVKVTDFGILAATMAARPAESPRLASRVPYLSPEQIAGEATSAASDVFVLGVIAYELVTGQRAYRGDTPAAIAQAILGGPPIEPALPRPIVRVLQRCLARSPFERFPDARALADALDAALRVAPVPGTRKDVGAQVKTTLERYAALNEGNLSGMVALNLGAPVAEVRPTQPTGSRRPEARTEPSPMPAFAPQNTPLPRVGGLATGKPPAATMTGMAPPPIRIPPGVVLPPGSGTIPKLPPKIPSVPKPAKAGALTQGWDAMPEGGMTVPDDSVFGQAPVDEEFPLAPPPPRNTPRPTPGHNFESTTGEMSAAQIKDLNQRAQLATSELAPLDLAPFQLLHELQRDGERPSQSEPEISLGEPPRTDEPDHDPSGTMPSLAPPPPARPASQPSFPVAAAAPSTSAAQQPTHPTLPATPSSRLPRIAAIVLAIGALGAGGYYAYNEFVVKKADDAPTTVAMGSGSASAAGSESGSAAVATATDVGSAGSAAVLAAGSDGSGSATGSDGSAAGSGSAGGSADGSGSAMATATGSDGSNAGSSAAAGSAAAGPGAGSNTGSAPNTAQPAQKSDQFEVTSTPPGARVFLDGAELGKTPVKQPGSADRHTLAVLLPDHALYIAEVDGAGVYNVALDPVKSAKSGPGIKIETCKAKNRYYIYVDGKPSGQTCPTAKRIVTTMGSHVVEVYDIVTETRKKYDVAIKDDRLSVRVKIDE